MTFVCLHATTPVFAKTLTGIEILTEQDETKIALELSGDVSPSIFPLANPDRLVIDLNETQISDGLLVIATDHPYFKDYRVGVLAKDQVRLVFDLKINARAGEIERHEQDGQTVLHIPIRQVSRAEYLKDVDEYQIIQAAIAERLTQAQEPQQQEKGNKPVVIIDPGHGGIDSGALGKTRVLEKNIMLEIAKKLHKKLLEMGEFDVHLTRDGDYFVPLNRRVNFAIEKQGDIFISLHADSFRQKSVNGTSVYTLSRKAKFAEDELLADQENRSDTLAGIEIIADQQPDVADILADFTARETKRFSLIFSHQLVKDLKRITKLRRRPIRAANFRVLRNHQIPSILIELGFLSNQSDERALKSEKWQKKVIGALAASIKTYFKKTKGNQSN